MPDEIRPALTPDEWQAASLEIAPPPDHTSAQGWAAVTPDAWRGGSPCLCIGTNDEELSSHMAWLTSDEAHGVVALANAALPDGDPRKITHADLAALWSVGYPKHIDRAGLARLYGKLAAILPPDPDA